MAVRKSTTAKSTDAIHLVEVDRGTTIVHLVGLSPLIFNRMQEKAMRDLLLPSGRKTEAFKQQNLKHEPIAEFRGSVYRWSDDEHPTRLRFPCPAFKGSMANAALEVPGAKKAQIGRLVWVEGHSVDIYGVPELLMSVVRSADIGKTPDIRTRAILREWCCAITIHYIRPTLSAQVLATLQQWAGLIVGIGDFRQEKGKGSYGQFRVVNDDDPARLRIMKTGGRAAQDKALEAATPFDDESAELLSWYNAEILKRGKQEPEAKKTGRKRKDDTATGAPLN